MSIDSIEEVRHDDEFSIEADNSEVQSAIWFKHGPLNDSTIPYIKSLQLIADSHDQGFVDDRLAGNWTWFEICILDSESATSPAKRGGIVLTWESHRTKMAKLQYKNYKGNTFGSQHDLLKFLQDGDFIAVRLCARFGGWELVAKNGMLKITKSDTAIDRETPNYRPALHEIKAVHNIMSQMHDVVQQGPDAASFPSLPKSLNHADNFSTGNEPPLRVLSLDGGGVRGLASLKLLKEVMDRKCPDKKPCEVFDMIGGTSTGGLIAIMLGRLEMTVDDCINKYEEFMDKVFAGNKWLHYARDTKFYDARELEKVVQNLVREKLGDENAPLFQGNDKCKVFVTAVAAHAADNRGPTIFRSYINRNEKSASPDIKVWEAARATSAAPAYFKPQTVGDDEFVDGGLGANNPVGWLWTEMLGVFGAVRPTDCFLSIGTGIGANNALKQPKRWPSFDVTKSFASVATNAEIMHVLFSCLIDAFAPPSRTTKYWRLNVHKVIEQWNEAIQSGFIRKTTVQKRHPQDYEAIPELDDVEGARTKFMDMLRSYLEEKDVQASIDACAAALCRSPVMQH